ncbi:MULTISPECIES: NAD-dependent epimerase/dehydratase family protein [Mammaliicoccus]|uniref:NAD(P)H-binding protein n=1 Tax=Mammaliicoccus fleurettii TaxID=150056 RepID=A0ABS5MLW0_9STAP|nr:MULTISPECIES: NAD-dependent epimerase/dehydratase family protein [Mammaliicoccus]HCN60357.1 3-beta hydroxysteroid dehydrogenase [Staphylococcus sp.]MBL0846301.1 NAD(P)H-binding protein [Mammaliicoccus fleurettii]MBS3671377.1 NAD(P)H-binding protein [Mammaliicoccus fleurettii]MBS3696669.1 NAD(P)H-binding protein [Mammaliicoccus fleurettii]MBW0765610.1 NAD(P)H-binding protein [Mammaliicoccus fleurettii]
MKANVLISGGSGYIGKHLISTLKDVGNLYTITKYEADMIDMDITWRKCDIYVLKDMIDALEGIDIAIYYLDPNKKSAKLTQSTARNLNLLASDNMAKACKENNVKKIIYITGSPFDQETIDTLKSTGIEVQATEQSIKRPAVSIELQKSKFDDVRSVDRMPIPYEWDMEQVVKYYFEWLQETSGTLVTTELIGDKYNVYFKHRSNPLLKLQRITPSIHEDLIQFKVVGGALAVNLYEDNGVLEFRKLRLTNEFIVHLYNYIPRIPWSIYYLSQAPIHNVTMKGFEVDCRIKDFQLRTTAGEIKKYTK